MCCAKLKRFIDVYLPITVCNLKCSYCYITQQNLFNIPPQRLKYSPTQIGLALSKERLGGVCCFNICGGGETMLSPDFIDVVRAILEQGHFVMVVTNGTISKKFEELLSVFPEEFLERLFFKFSFQYLELLRRGMLEKFFDNVLKIKNSPASFSLELGASDDFIEHLDDIKRISIEKVGALPHITLLRDDRIEGRPILTSLSMDEYKRVWGSFNSELFRLRLEHWGKKRWEFCYAGDWAGCISLEDGFLRQCNRGKALQNVFENPVEPINFCAIGNNCPEKHCYISHAWLTFGVIPELEEVPFIDMRNRTSIDGSEWVKPRFKRFLSQKLKENNKPYSLKNKILVNKLSSTRKKIKVAEKLFSIDKLDKNGKNKHIIRVLGLKITLSN